ncbi:hypothetical protein B7939_04570 [Eggerthia catenaformis]|nr:hypothetical protein B7939_04570 [Eggerthia catenaformis]
MRSLNIKAKAKLVSVVKRVSHKSLIHIIVDHLSSSPKIASYQKLFLLGIHNDLESDYQKMISLSIVHLFALSGMHITALSNILNNLLSYLLSQKKASVLTRFLLGIYVFSIPYNISLWRAYFMLFHDYFKKYLNSLDFLSLLVMISLIYNPFILFNLSFIFSYFIYLIVLLTKNLKYSFVCVYLSSIPIILSVNYSIYPFSFVLGCLLMPFIKYFYLLTVLSLFIPFVQYLLIIFINIFDSILKSSYSLSHEMIFGKPNLLFIGIYYFLLAQIIIRQQLKKTIHRHLLCCLSLLIIFNFYSNYKFYAEVTMIDVGQGDCTFIRLPFDQGNYLIDTGGDRNYDIALNRVIPYLKSRGVKRLDTVFISHYDYDHSGALDSLKKHFDVREVIDKPFKERKKKDFSISCLTVETKSKEKNDKSNILYMTLFNIHYLFTGDISSEVEKALANKYRSLNVDILKVPHHGSKYSSSVALFEMIHPKAALIGVGRNNKYHHPSSLVLKRLKERGILTLRTDRDSNITIIHYRKHYYIFR